MLLPSAPSSRLAPSTRLAPLIGLAVLSLAGVAAPRGQDPSLGGGIGPVDAAPERAGADEGGVTFLTVRVVDRDGAPVDDGRVEYLAGGVAHPECSDAPLRGVARVSDGEAIVLLPATCSEAFLVASAPGCGAAEGRASRLRGVDDEHRPQGRLDRTVEVVLAGAPSGPRATGRITVDGRPRVPAGLHVLLRYRPPSPAGSVEEFLACAPRLGLVDPALGTYSAGPLTAAVEELTVLSRETVPRSFPIEWAPGEDAPSIDLDLSRGKTLVVTVRETTGEPSPWTALRVETQFVVSSDASTTHYASHSALRYTDATGKLVLEGLPAAGFVLIWDDVSPEHLARGLLRQRGAARPFKHTLTEAGPAEDSIVLEVAPRPRRSTRLWGRVAEPGDAVRDARGPRKADWCLVLAPQGEEATEPLRIDVDVDVDAGRWSCEIPRGTSYDLRLRSADGRLSAPLALHALTPVLGPIDLDARVLPAGAPFPLSRRR